MVPHMQFLTNYGHGCLLNAKKYFLIHQQPILQLVDNCTSDIVTFPLFKDFPALLLTQSVPQGLVCSCNMCATTKGRTKEKRKLRENKKTGRNFEIKLSQWTSEIQTLEIRKAPKSGPNFGGTNCKIWTDKKASCFVKKLKTLKASASRFWTHGYLKVNGHGTQHSCPKTKLVRISEVHSKTHNKR